MDALNFLKFWRPATMTTTSITSSTVPHLVVETDSESDEEDSFFDLELTVHDFDIKENNSSSDKIDDNPIDKIMGDYQGVGSKQDGLSKMVKMGDNIEVDFSKTTLSMSPNEPISKRKVLPIEPISKPQSPIALLKSAPSFRISIFKKPQRMAPQRKTEETGKAECGMGKTYKQQKKETKVFAVKLNLEEPHYFPTLSRDNSSRNHGSKFRNSEETKSERFSKDLLQKYLKMIKPLYVKVSKRYSDKMKFSEEVSSASPVSSPSVVSISSRKEKHGSFAAGILGKSRSASAATGVASPANRSDDTLLQQHDGIQSAILHCKRSFNSREGSVHSLRNSFEDDNGANM